MKADNAVNLNEREVHCLALRIAASYVANLELEWEDYPMLGEFTFQRVDELIRAFAADCLRGELRRAEQAWDIDSADLLERAWA